MSALPLEILLEICGFAKEISLQTLHSASLVNHLWYEAAATLIYDHLTIKFSAYADLQRTVEEIVQNGKGRPFLAHARRLDIMTFPLKERLNLDDEGRLGSHGRIPNIYDYFAKPIDFVPEAAGPFMEGRYLTHWCLPGLNVMHPTPGPYSEKDWQPLVSLVSSLSRLAELNYAVENMFPGCLLRAIHDHHPACRLSIWSFQILGLNAGLGRIHPVNCPHFDSADLELLRSPCLHAIRIYYPVENYRYLHEDMMHQYAIIPVLASAPNLKHIQLYLSHDVEKDYSDRITRANNEWEAFFDDSGLSYSANLALFSFLERSREDRAIPLLKWNQLADLSQLRSLDIDQIRSPMRMGEAVSHLVKLDRLYFNASPALRPWSTYADELRAMFDRLHPLKYLYIRALHDKSFLHDILVRQRELRGLMIEPTNGTSIVVTGRDRGYIYPLFEPSDIACLSETCLELVELRIPIQRSKGDDKEC